MIEQGMSGDDVIAAYVANYGEKIRIAPEAQGFNLLAWLGPLAALLAGCIGMFWLARRWSGRRVADDEGGSQRALPADDPYVAKLNRELEERS